MSKAKKIVAAACLLGSTSAFALGIGDITTYSALNQALNAEISLVGSENEDPRNIRISIASKEAFDEAGIDRPFYLNELKFAPIVEENGQINVKVTTKKIIKEPFVNFIIDLEWPKGHTLKEFTILLDPPVTMKDVNPTLVVPESTTGSAHNSIAPDVDELQIEEIVHPSSPKTTESNTYGPTIKHDTLWSIAKGFAAQNSSVSHEQMMLALFNSNPEAFYQKNINALKKGHILKLPDQQTINKLSVKQARVAFLQQNIVWSESFQASKDAAKPAIENVSDDSSENSSIPTSETTPSTEAKLKLLTPTENAVSPDAKESNSDGQSTGAVNTEKQDKNIALEMVATLEDEKNEATSRVVDLETQVEKLQHLLTLMDEQLAQLQNNAKVINELEVKKDNDKDLKTGAKDEQKTQETKQQAAQKIPVDEELNKPTPVVVEKTQKKQPKKSLPKESEEDNLLLYAGGGLAILLLGLFFIRKKKNSTIEDGSEVKDFAIETPESAAAIEDIEDDLEEEFLDDFSVDEGPEDVDPLIACDELLDNNQLQEAEELIKKARINEPNNMTYTQKLFEVFYRASNAEAFETLANDFNEIQHSNPEVWEEVEQMGKELCPTSVLFMAHASPKVATETTLEASDTNAAADKDDVEFDFNFDLVKQTDESSTPSETVEEDSNEAIEPLLQSTATKKEAVTEPMKHEEITAEDISTEEALDQDNEVGDIDFEVSASTEESELPSTDTYSDSSMKDIETKISLAKIYIEMQDETAAKETLEDVISHGSDEQKKEAKSMLDKL